jgi:hypothetical protein
MERVIRPKEQSRNLAIGCLISFLLIGIASTFGMWFSALPERRFLAAAFMVVFWGFWVLLSCWVLLAYWREELRIKDGRITQRSVIGLKEIDLRSLTAVRWRIMPQGGSLVLTTATKKLKICLDNFEPEERIWLTRYIRNGVSTDLQDGWALFCHKIAVPLRDKRKPSHADPGTGNVRITRKKWDWYFVPAVVLFAVLGVVQYWYLEQPRMLAQPVAVVGLWLLVRFMTPREGLVAERITSRPETVGYLIFMAWWLAAVVIGIVLFEIWSPPMPAAAIIGGTALILWYAILFWRCYQFDRVRRKRDEEVAIASIRKWDEGEAAGGNFSVEEPTSYA